MLKLTKLIEEGVGVVDEEVFVGQKIQLDNDLGEVDWVLLNIYQTIVGFHSLLSELAESQTYRNIEQS